MSQNVVTVEMSTGVVGEGFRVVDGAGREDRIWEVGVRVAAGRRHIWAPLSPKPGHPRPRLLPEPIKRSLSLEGSQLKRQCQGPTIHHWTHEWVSTSPDLEREHSSRHKCERYLSSHAPLWPAGQTGQNFVGSPRTQGCKQQGPLGALVEQE